MTHGYFKPIRRKIGVVTLVVACVFMPGWVRSFMVRDHLDFNRLIKIPTNRGLVSSILSDSGFLWFMRTDLENVTSVSKVQNATGSADGLTPMPYVQRRLLQVVRISELPIVATPYWSIVLPLTLASAFLLLSEPRAKKIEPTESPPKTES